MSISELLVPNNFNIHAKSVTSSGGLTATSLYSNNSTNVIDINASANPAQGDVLIATSNNSAVWSSPTIPGIEINQGFGVVITEDGARKTVWDSGALPDGVYACSAVVAANPSNAAGISAYRPGACILISGGVSSLRGNGIENNIGGVGAGAVSLVPLFTVSGADSKITLSAGDAAGTTMDVSGSVQIVQIL